MLKRNIKDQDILRPFKKVRVEKKARYWKPAPFKKSKKQKIDHISMDCDHEITGRKSEGKKRFDPYAGDGGAWVSWYDSDDDIPMDDGKPPSYII